MPIQLTVPFAAGGFDSQDYTHAQIRSFCFDGLEQMMMVNVELGYMSGGKFIAGIPMPGKTVNSHVIRDQGGDSPVTDFYTLTTKTVGPTAGATIYDRMVHELYQYLLDKGYYQGAIV